MSNYLFFTKSSKLAFYQITVQQTTYSPCTTLIEKQTNQNEGKVFSCFVDFKKAFDSIWHEGLLYKLMESGVGGKTYDIIKSMYTNNKCAVKIGKKTHISSHRAVG